MPVTDSGAALFAGSADEFIEMAPASSLTTHLTREFNRRWGTASESEIRSWRNSLTALASVVHEAGLAQSGVGVELRLPFSNKRIDCSFVGRDAAGHPQVRLVELKQWSSAASSDFPDNVKLGNEEFLHPSVQAASYAAYLRDSHSAFTEEGFGLAACAYLHNMSSDGANAIRGLAYGGAISEAPFFTKSEEGAFAEYLRQGLSGGGGMQLLPSLTLGRFSPSKTLIAGVAKGLKESPIWTLLDEQRVAYNIVRGLVATAVAKGEKAVVIIRGGPGTGKSVIAAHLLVDLSKPGSLKVAHATGSKAFTTNLRAIGPSGSDSLFRYFNSFMHKRTDPNALDVLLCDEAHRIRDSSNDRFTPKRFQSAISQTEELIRAARVTVFLLDERQNVRLGEIGTPASIRTAAKSLGVEVHEISLSGQFRCNGCNGYVDWVDSLMSVEPVPVGPWRTAGEYELEVFGDPFRLERAIRAKAASGASARMVAGFCWPWSDPGSDGSLADDVQIGSWRRRWNEKSPEQQKGKRSAPPAKRHPYYLWTTEPERISEIGCIYSAQGFEFDYCGVILGNDLVWRAGVGWVASRDASEDPSIKRRKFEENELLSLLHHTYRVLLTRGMKGTYIYSVDVETRLHLERLLLGTAGSTESPGTPDPRGRQGSTENSITSTVEVADLAEPLAGEVRRWAEGPHLDPEQLNKVVARGYGLLGRYASAEYRVDSARGPLLEVRFTPGSDFDPLKADESFLRGLDDAQKGNLSAAFSHFKSAVEANPLVSEYHRAAGQAALELGSHDDAEQMLLYALYLDPASWEAKTMLGNVYYARDNLDLALAMHSAAALLDQNEHTLTNLGATLGKRGDYRAARDAFAGALGHNRANLKAQHGLRLCDHALAREGPESN